MFYFAKYKAVKRMQNLACFHSSGVTSRDGASFVSLLRIYRQVADALINSRGHTDHTETGSRRETEMGKGQLSGWEELIG